MEATMTTALDNPELETMPSTDVWGLSLTDPVSISHGGTVLLFAGEAGEPVEHLYYNVRIAGTGPGDMAAQWGDWHLLELTEPVRGANPEEPSADELPLHRLAGMDLVTVSPVATTPAPADAPFCVASDGKYVSCLRQSTAGTLYLDRFLLVETPAPVTDDRTEAAGATTYVLQRAWEVRYRRSGRRDAPDGPDDTLDYRDMLGLPFLEPTIEIVGVPGISSGKFAVLLAPAATEGGMRWHIFTVAN